MLSSLLVPLDGSSFAECSLPLACEVARTTGGRLHLARVHEVHEHAPLESSFRLGEEGRTEDDTRRRRDEEEELQELGVRIQEEAGCPVTCVLLDGPVVPALVAHADEASVDLVVMTTHGRSGIRRVFMGSVADDLVRSAAFPTILVHPGCASAVVEDGWTVRHLLVPLDGSMVAEGVLRPAADLAPALGGRVTLTHVVSVESAFGLRPVQLFRYRSELRWARSYLEAVARRIRGPDLDVRIHEIVGSSPAVTVADVADELEADLIAVGTRGLRGLRRAVHGSVAHRLLRLGRRPLLVVRGARRSRN